jgi:hypothetical protein
MCSSSTLIGVRAILSSKQNSFEKYFFLADWKIPSPIPGFEPNHFETLSILSSIRLKAGFEMPMSHLAWRCSLARRAGQR